MAFHMLATYTWGQFLVATLVIGVCLLLMLIILLQKGRGEGLAGAFGGGGGSSAFGAKTGDVFTWITVSLAVIFIGLSVVANFVFDESAVAANNIAAIEGGSDTEPPAKESTTPTTPTSEPELEKNIPTPDAGDVGTEAGETPADVGGEDVDEAPSGDVPAGELPGADDKESPPNP